MKPALMSVIRPHPTSPFSSTPGGEGRSTYTERRKIVEVGTCIHASVTCAQFHPPVVVSLSLVSAMHPTFSFDTSTPFPGQHLALASSDPSARRAFPSCRLAEYHDVWCNPAVGTLVLNKATYGADRVHRGLSRCQVGWREAV